jgi:hypothetical protein
LGLLKKDTAGFGALTAETYDVEDCLMVGISTFRDMSSVGDWTGVTTKGSATIFVTGLGLVCWNCGGKHNLTDCQKPKDEATIKKNRDEYFKKKNEVKKKKKEQKEKEKKAKKQGNRQKWRPPEANENNRRTINGKPHVYNRDTKRWDEVRSAGTDHPGAAPAAAPATTTTAANDTSRALAIANTSRTINNAFQNLIAQLE